MPGCFGRECLLDNAVHCAPIVEKRTSRAHTIAGLERLGLLTLVEVLGDHGSTDTTSVNSTIVARSKNARATKKIAAVTSRTFTVGLLHLEF